MSKVQHTHFGQRLMPGHRNMPGAFTGRSSRNYDRVARWLLPRAYRRLATDVAVVASEGGGYWTSAPDRESCRASCCGADPI